jgi:7-keto-8-aminopelargonate synthetase-like enzyme
MKNVINSIENVMDNLISSGIGHLYTEDEAYHSNHININNKNLINFGSCSYLGLEFDKKLINGAIKAVRNYGTQFSASRGYVSCGLYAELEARFDYIFSAHCVVTPTTTLGHIATIPTLVEREDAVIIDQQVHSSVQTAVQLLKPKGVYVEVVRHNRMDLLEERIKILRAKHKKIWYMADGVYSMYGDKAPLDTIYNFMNSYPEFHFYVDDAHGMSCYGQNGQGYVLSNHVIHEKMIVATSLAKGFATGGAVIVFPTKELALKVRKCGGPMITSGPMQPAALGAAIASADIHISSEITKMQEDLHENIKYTNAVFNACDLPLVAHNDTPIFFVGAGLPKVGYNLVKRMMTEGMYTNIGAFPAVPMKNTGLRFTITKLHTFEQISKLAEAMAHHYPLALEEEGYSLEEVKTAFKMEDKESVIQENKAKFSKVSNLAVNHQQTIEKINKEEWDSTFSGKGTFDWDGIKMLEETFKNNLEMENNWVFDYIDIKDSKSGKTILKTFVSTALTKDDMMADASVSEQIEYTRRTENPYYLTSKVVSLGSLLTTGEHLYVDFESEHHQEALSKLFEILTQIQEREKASSVMLRDFLSPNPLLDKVFSDNGYFKAELPESHVLANPSTGEHLLKRISKNKRVSIKKNVLKNYDLYEATLIKNPSFEQIEHWYQLYLNVKANKSELNTFQLPFKLFQNIATAKGWEVIELKLKPAFNSSTPCRAVSVLFNYKSGDSYSLMMIGLDYEFSDFKPYQQTLYRGIERAEELQVSEVFMGLTASFEKQKFGAEAVPTYSYMQIDDHYNMEVIQAISSINGNKKIE